MSEEIIDLDTMRMDTRLVKIAGHKIKPFVSFDTMLIIMEKTGELKDGDTGSTAKMMGMFKGVVEKILKESDPTIDSETFKAMDAKQYLSCIKELIVPIINDLVEDQKEITGGKKKQD